MSRFFLALLDLLFDKGPYSTAEHTFSGLSALVSSLLVEADLTPPRLKGSVSVYDPVGGTGALLAAVEERLSATQTGKRSGSPARILLQCSRSESRLGAVDKQRSEFLPSW